MNFARICRVLAGFVVFFTAVQLVPLGFALAEEPIVLPEPFGRTVDAQSGFLASLGVGVVVSALLGLAGRRATGEFFRRETICVAGVSWFLASLLGAIPFQWSGLLPAACDPIFESTSGLATCGATVLGSGGNPAPEAVPASLLLWRAMLQWLGGIGIVLVFVALMPSMGAAGRSLMMSESVGVSMEGYQPRVLSQSRAVVAVYVTLTAACTVALVWIGGFGWFDATCHAFTCLATGGYSTKTSIAVFDNLGAEVVLTVFMYLGGCSFTMMAASARDGWRGFRAMARSSEFRTYTVFTVVAVAAVTADIVRRGEPFGSALRQSSFNVVSMLSCCGYAISDFHAWPPLSLIVIFVCTVVGGCSGSAAGGLKQVRFLVCLELLAYQVRHFVRPKSVERLQLDGEVLQASTISSVLAMVLLWLLSILLGALVIALDQRLSFLGALSASASMLAGVGPAMAVVQPEFAATVPAIGQTVGVVGPNIGPLGGFGDLWGGTKLAMSFEMILGRLELLTLLALFSPSFWRR